LSSGMGILPPSFASISDLLLYVKYVMSLYAWLNLALPHNISYIVRGFKGVRL
jgi:hypothetical protein